MDAEKEVEKDQKNLLTELLGALKDRDDDIIESAINDLLEDTKAGLLNKYCQVLFWRPGDSMIVPGTNIRVTCHVKDSGPAIFKRDNQSVYLIKPERGSVPNVVSEGTEIIALTSPTSTDGFSHWMLSLLNGIFEEISHITIVRGKEEIALLASKYPLKPVDKEGERKTIGSMYFGDNGNYGSDISVVSEKELHYLEVNSHAFGDAHSNISIYLNSGDQLRALADELNKAADIIDSEVE
jgi:hypothetical protein